MVEVRHVRPGDEPTWRSLWRDYLAFYETRLPEDVYRNTFARLVDPEVRDCWGLLAVVEGVDVGLAHCITHRHGWRIDDVCYLQDLYVSPLRRSAGAGRALIEAVYAEADARGCGDVYWLTQTFNEPARRLYDRVAAATPFIRYRR